jgi:hypothetical protein
MGIETGWTSTWIAAGLGIPEISGAASDGSYWSLVSGRSLAPVARRYCEIMFAELAPDACKTAAPPLKTTDDAAAAFSPSQAIAYCDEPSCSQVRKTPSWPRSWANCSLL